MRRRTFIAGLATLPLAAHAQRTGKPPIIGYIGANTEAIDRPRVDASMHRLADLGWVEGRSVVVDVQWSNGVIARAGETASDFAQRPVDLILTAGDGQVIA